MKLCDFGIAKAFQSDAFGDTSEVSSGPRVAGKCGYMSPEQARGEPLDARSDVYGAAVLLWELFAGRRRYRGSEEEILAMAKRGDAPALPDRGLPQAEELQSIIERALHPDREARFETAAEFLYALEGWSIRAGLMGSQLRFGSFLSEHFSRETVDSRRERELAAEQVCRALAKGPPLVVQPTGKRGVDRAAEGPSAPAGEVVASGEFLSFEAEDETEVMSSDALHEALTTLPGSDPAAAGPAQDGNTSATGRGWPTASFHPKAFANPHAPVYLGLAAVVALALALGYFMFAGGP